MDGQDSLAPESYVTGVCRRGLRKKGVGDGGKLGGGLEGDD